MLRFNLFNAFLLLSLNIISAQKDTTRLKIGIGSGIGFFYPRAINNYINHQHHKDQNNSSNYIVTNYFINNTNSYTFLSNLEIRNINEAAISGTSQYDKNNNINQYYFWRLSTGGCLNYKIQISDIFSFRPGIGILAHYLRFNNYHHFTMGERIQLNFDFINNEIITFESYVATDFASTNINNPNIKELNYSGFLIGAIIYLNIFKGNTAYF
ncbi:MAG: hypothetical protein JXR39_00980 [Marinilabiliaceae bacterium]|nr:hypothetical protein [Marinilabiliaceae bacterium]